MREGEFFPEAHPIILCLEEDKQKSSQADHKTCDGSISLALPGVFWVLVPEVRTRRGAQLILNTCAASNDIPGHKMSLVHCRHSSRMLMHFVWSPRHSQSELSPKLA
jgi:hypothetical protein